ncbi:DUF924 family protein [Arhodomonas sp. AD133]|uniref:DUF924 family protein n=1 Tax=Arhodomonas sp. AD133 TaxID=3415009 RepID=UPI003EBD1C8D
MADKSEDILTYWFGEHAPSQGDGDVARERQRLWFSADDTVDADIEARFGQLLVSAARGELERWSETPRGRLALIILLDQFSRNIYRGTPDAYANDRMALAHSLEGQTRGQDRELRPVERIFFYMPMMHTEALPVQDEAVQRFQALAEAVEPGERDAFQPSVDAAQQHREIILRFDRFPHRNRILGRDSTPAELAFLETPGSSFP